MNKQECELAVDLRKKIRELIVKHAWTVMYFRDILPVEYTAYELLEILDESVKDYEKCKS